MGQSRPCKVERNEEENRDGGRESERRTTRKGEMETRRRRAGIGGDKKRTYESHQLPTSIQLAEKQNGRSVEFVVVVSVLRRFRSVGLLEVVFEFREGSRRKTVSTSTVKEARGEDDELLIRSFAFSRVSLSPSHLPPSPSDPISPKTTRNSHSLRPNQPPLPIVPTEPLQQLLGLLVREGLGPFALLDVSDQSSGGEGGDRVGETGSDDNGFDLCEGR